MNFESVKKNFDKGLWTIAMIKTAVKKGVITKDEYLAITGIEYENPSRTTDFESIKLNKIELSKTKLAEWLETHPYQYTDGKYYSVTEEKQALLNGNLSSYERATNTGIPYPLKWNSTGEECVDWEYSDLIALSLSIAGYVAPRVSAQQAFELEIKACASLEDLEKIVIAYE